MSSFIFFLFFSSFFLKDTVALRSVERAAKSSFCFVLFCILKKKLSFLYPFVFLLFKKKIVQIVLHDSWTSIILFKYNDLCTERVDSCT